MPYMIGKEPIRRTVKYLEAGRLYLKKTIQIFSVNYHEKGDHNQGARDFVFWNIPQVQYKNPSVQIIMFRNLTPSPFIKCYYENGKTMLIDVEGKTKEQIMEHLINVVGKSKEVLEKEKIAKEKKENMANFGVGCERSCICTIPGQVPCPGVVPLPYHMRGKYIFNKELLEEVLNKRNEEDDK